MYDRFIYCLLRYYYFFLLVVFAHRCVTSFCFMSLQTIIENLRCVWIENIFMHLSIYLYIQISIYLCAFIRVSVYICNIYATKTSNKFSVFRQNQNFFYVPQQQHFDKQFVYVIFTFCASNFAVCLKSDFDHFSTVRRSKILLSEEEKLKLKK